MVETEQPGQLGFVKYTSTSLIPSPGCAQVIVGAEHVHPLVTVGVNVGVLVNVGVGVGVGVNITSVDVTQTGKMAL